MWQCDSCHTVPSSIITIGSFSNAINHLLLWHVSHNNLLTLLMHLRHQKISKNNFWNLWRCDRCLTVTFTNIFCGHLSIVTNVANDLQVWYGSQNNHFIFSKHQCWIQNNFPYFQKSDSVTAVAMSHFQILFLFMYQLSQISQLTYKCEMGHKITMSNYESINF